MPNLIAAFEVNNTLIEQFSAEGTGFPDQTMLKPSDGETRRLSARKNDRH